MPLCDERDLFYISLRLIKSLTSVDRRTIWFNSLALLPAALSNIVVGKTGLGDSTERFRSFVSQTPTKSTTLISIKLLVRIDLTLSSASQMIREGKYWKAPSFSFMQLERCEDPKTTRLKCKKSSSMVGVQETCRLDPKRELVSFHVFRTQIRL